MKKSHKRGKKRLIATAIITVALVAVFIAAVFIANMFVPVLYLSAYSVKSDYSRPQGLEITFLNVGFGDCAFVALPDGKNMLIDGGNGNYGKNMKILKFLNSHGVDTINYLVCTSVKDEHCDGLSEVVRYKKVEHAFIPYCKNRHITRAYNSLLRLLERRKVSYTYAGVSEGIYSEESDYFITFLSPTNYLSLSSEYAALNNKANTENIENASVIVWMEYGNSAVIFTSDARPAALERIVEDYEMSVSVGHTYCNYGGKGVELTKCKVVTSPAHAGERNTSSAFYDFIRPELAIVSVGKNFAGYPSPVAISDIQRYCKPLYTVYDGDITVLLKDDGYLLNTQNETRTERSKK